LNVVDRILRMPELDAAPPVLVDIGAAEGMHPPWRRIAKYAVCVAFEADERELDSVTSEATGFRQLTTYNYLASESSSASEPFHLTASPYCSSRLAPRDDLLRHYAFAPLFRVEETVEVRARDVRSVLDELDLDHIDWLKVDSQGTDLRLVRSLGADLLRRTLVVELEPGIIDAYEGEDKLSHVLDEMGGSGFWVSGLKVLGSTRIDNALARSMLGERATRYLDLCHKAAPGWAEIEYFNSFEDESVFGKRELLLGYAFAFTRRHYAFALELADKGRRRFGAPFDDLATQAVHRLRVGFSRLPLLVASALGGRLLRR
jgi:FkbM family methyltransferase